jgi:putative transposase
MPRSARIVLPNTPHHIVQRGHNRQTVFVSDDDYNYYRDNLIFFKKKFECRIYAYCLMTNHVHLVVDPGPNPESLSLLMKRVAGRQTRYVNKLEKRTGSLWEGRFKSSIVSQREYSAACCRYVELNPLRAGMVTHPGQYRWSSYGCKGEGKKDPVVDFDSSYLAMGRNKSQRQSAYAEYVLGTVPEDELKLIRESLQRGQLTGSRRFREEISAKIGIRFSNRGPGRPKKAEK